MSTTIKDLAGGVQPDLRVWHPLQLPSKGRFYKSKDGQPLCPDGMVDYALWTTHHEEILVRYGGTDGLIDKMLMPNVKLPAGLKYEDLLIADQFFLLMKLRAESLCPFFSYTLRCFKCKKQYEPQANLRELKLLDGEAAADEPIPCYLPHAKKEVTLRYPRVKDSQAVEKYQRDREDKLGEQGVTFYQYARQIESIDGQSVPFNERQTFVAQLIMLDTSAIRMVLEDNDIGYSLMDESECAHCGTLNKAEVPIDERFFRPSRADIAEAIRVAQES